MNHLYCIFVCWNTYWEPLIGVDLLQYEFPPKKFLKKDVMIKLFTMIILGYNMCRNSIFGINSQNFIPIFKILLRIFRFWTSCTSWKNLVERAEIFITLFRNISKTVVTTLYWVFCINLPSLILVTSQLRKLACIMVSILKQSKDLRYIIFEISFLLKLATHFENS